MSGMRIRWETAAKVIAGVAAALVIVGLAPSLLAPREPEPLPDDVGLTPPPRPPVPLDARVADAARGRKRAAARRRRASRRPKRLGARRLAARRRQRGRRRHSGDQDASPDACCAPVAIVPAFTSPPPAPSAADEFGFER